MATASPFEIKASTLIPDLLRERPKARQILDRYGLRGCGGRLGPYETLEFFARAHDVPLDQLLSEINAEIDGPISVVTNARPSDVIYRRFFLSGIAVVLTLGAAWGAWLLLQIAWTGSFRSASLHSINAHGHAQIFGWVGLFVMGFAYQAFPRFKHTDLAWPGLALASWWLMIVGILIRSVFEPLAADQPMWIGLVMAAACLEIFAIGICAVVLVKTWRKSTKPLVYYDAYIICALGWFFIQAVADAVYLAATLLIDPSAKTELVATWQAAVRDLQIHGFATLMILGVSQRMLHHVYGFPAPSERLSLCALPLLNLAIIGEAIGLILMQKVGPRFAIVWYGSVLVFALTIGKLVADWKVFYRVRESDRSLKFIRAAYAWLLISLGMMVIFPAYQRGLLPWLAPESAAAVTGFSHAFYGAVRHAITVGFISMMIVGVAARIVPTLNGLDGAKLPRLWLPFVLLNLGCSLRVGGQIMTDFFGSAFSIAGVSGVLEVTALAIWAFHLIAIMAGRYQAKGTCGCSARHLPVMPGEAIVGGQIVGEVIDAYPNLLPTFIEFGFRPMSNPVLRRTLAHGITIDRACTLLHVDAAEFLAILNSRAGKLRTPLMMADSSAPVATAPTCSCCTERSPSKTESPSSETEERQP